MQDEFEQLYRYLLLHPEDFVWRKKVKPKLNTQQGKDEVWEKYLSVRNSQLSVSTPSTVPDEAVSVVIMASFGYTPEQAQYIKLTHAQSMACENMVGELLERYLDTILKRYGWIRCWGDMVNKIDFIKPSAQGNYRKLQIKNRNNSENSSSSSVRNGTDIEKWFRSFSRGGTNWDAFPEVTARQQLSETGFQEFINRTLSQN